MKKLHLVFFAAAVLAFLFLWLIPNSIFLGDVEEKKIHGIAYGPHRSWQSPEGEQPSLEDIRNDIQFLGAIAERIRIYGTSGNMAYIPEIAQEYGLGVVLTVLLDKNHEKNIQKITDAVNLAQDNDNVESLVIGNDILLYGILSKEQVIEYLQETREMLGTNPEIAVTMSESWEQWNEHPEIVEHVDYVMIHVYPYYDGINVDESAQYILDKHDILASTLSGTGKSVVIGETGWPSTGMTICKAESDQQSQEEFLEDFLEVVNENDLEYFIFEAFDEQWKTNDDVFSTLDASCFAPTENFPDSHHPEKHFGIFFENGTVKESLIDVMPTHNRTYVR